MGSCRSSYLPIHVFCEKLRCNPTPERVDVVGCFRESAAAGLLHVKSMSLRTVASAPLYCKKEGERGWDAGICTKDAYRHRHRNCIKLTPPVLAPPLFWNILYYSQHHKTVHNLFIFNCQRLQKYSLRVQNPILSPLRLLNLPQSPAPRPSTPSEYQQ